MKIYILKQIVLSKGEEIYKGIGSLTRRLLLFNYICQTQSKSMRIQFA